MIDVCQAGKFLKEFKEFDRKRKECSNSPTSVIISIKKKEFHICKICWVKIANSPISFGGDNE